MVAPLAACIISRHVLRCRNHTGIDYLLLSAHHLIPLSMIPQAIWQLNISEKSKFEKWASACAYVRVCVCVCLSTCACVRALECLCCVCACASVLVCLSVSARVNQKSFAIVYAHLTMPQTRVNISRRTLVCPHFEDTTRSSTPYK